MQNKIVYILISLLYCTTYCSSDYCRVSVLLFTELTHVHAGLVFYQARKTITSATIVIEHCYSNSTAAAAVLLVACLVPG